MFYRPSEANTIQLFVAIKGNFSGVFFFEQSPSEGKFPRGYFINVATIGLDIIKIDSK